jgi:3D (Asp-Asp-Asp) domain-containing protein
MNFMHIPECPGRRRKSIAKLVLAAGVSMCIHLADGQAVGPLAAKINITTLQSYSGSDTLPKPTKILVYDFAIDTSSVQVDKSQKLRPRHIVAGDENPEAVAKKASTNFSDKLIASLSKTGIPVEHAAADVVAPDNSLSVQGAFVSLRQGDKAERVGVGMGAGSADVQTKVDVHLKTAADAILLSQFQTETKPAENMGAGVPAAAGMNPAAVGAKSTITDRKKTLDAYASKTADVMAEEITKQMARQGWIKLNDKGEVIR